VFFAALGFQDISAGGQKAGSQPLPSNKTKPLLDSLGDPLPEGAIARWGSARLWQDGIVNSLCFSPDGKVLVTASTDVNGNFTLSNVPVTTQVPIVIQKGRFRRILQRSKTGRA